jgi:hypothetical protein
VSYDLRLWTAKPVSDTGTLMIKGHAVSVGESVAAEPEDMPAEVLLSVPGIQYLTDIHVEPILTDNANIDKVLRYAKRLSKEASGVVEDPQTGLVHTPQGSRTASLPPIARDDPTVSLSWYMDTSSPLKDKLCAFVDLLKEIMPQALPRRYGSWEPPQYKLAETGLAHLKEFLVQEPSPVWYASKPVAYVFLNDACAAPFSAKDYRCNHIELMMQASCLNLTNWNYTAKKLLRQAAVLLKPFYAETVISGESGVCSWWWKGLPAAMGSSIIIGPPYSRLMPAMRQYEMLSDDMYYADNGDGTAGRKLKAAYNKMFSHPKITFRLHRRGHAIPSADDYQYAKEFPFKR